MRFDIAITHAVDLLYRGLQFRASALLVLAVLLTTQIPVYAGAQADAALAAVQSLRSKGEIPADATLNLMFKPGNINALLGPGLELQREWEGLTGTRISARLFPNEPALEALLANPDVDITVARPHEYSDLLSENVVIELGPLAERFAFSMSDKPPQGFIRPELQSYYGDRLVGIPADGDVAIMYLRKDLMDDPKERAAFRSRYGRELGVPQTWDEYDQLVSFFHRPEQGLVGAAEERDPDAAWMYWMQRYYSAARPYQPLFDAQAHPLIDSPAGITATRHYVHTARHSAPEITGEGRGYSFTLPIFMQGKAFASMFTLAGAKLHNSPASAVRGKFVAVPMPGYLIGKDLVRRNVPIYGNNLVISARSGQKALAFLFAMWLTDPDVSLRTVGTTGGHTDPYRWHHLQDARVEEIYTRDALEVFVSEWAIALPAGTGLLRDRDYMAALDRHLLRAARGEISPEDAMRACAEDWEKITESVGRRRQIEALREFERAYTNTETNSESMPSKTRRQVAEK